MNDVPEKERHSRWYGATDGVNDLDRKPDAILETTTVLVYAFVRDGTEKLAYEVPVCGVYLNNVETSLHCALRSVDEGCDDLFDPLLRQLFRDKPTIGIRNRARTNNLIRPPALLLKRGGARVDEWCEGRSFATGVSKLDGDFLVLGMCELNDLSPRGCLLVRPDTGIFWGDAALRDDGGRFDYSEAGTSSEDSTNFQRGRQDALQQKQ